MPTPTTRIEIADLIEGEFDGSTRTADELVNAARAVGARSRVVEALATLPPEKFAQLSDLWKHLPDLDVEP